LGALVFQFSIASPLKYNLGTRDSTLKLQRFRIKWIEKADLRHLVLKVSILPDIAIGSILQIIQVPLFSLLEFIKGLIPDLESSVRTVLSLPFTVTFS
jgi:hypothetical protein